jgi:cell shape-determining protein MreD
VHGTADLVMLILISWGIYAKSSLAWIWALTAGLVMSLFTKINWLAILLPYLIIFMLTRVLHTRFWNSPILAMLLVSIIGTFLLQATALMSLFFIEIPFKFSQAFSDVIVPSVFLNLLLALPVLFIMKDVSRWIYPQEENE